MLRLAKLLDRRDFAAKAEETLRGYRQTMAEHPAAAGQMLIALDFYLGPTNGGRGGRHDERAGHDAGARTPSAGVPTESGDRVPRSNHRAPPPDLIPLLKDKPTVDDTVTVYVCENFACKAPLVGARRWSSFSASVEA